MFEQCTHKFATVLVVAIKCCRGSLKLGEPNAFLIYALAKRSGACKKRSWHNALLHLGTDLRQYAKHIWWIAANDSKPNFPARMQFKMRARLMWLEWRKSSVNTWKLQFVSQYAEVINEACIGIMLMKCTSLLFVILLSALHLFRLLLLSLRPH